MKNLLFNLELMDRHYSFFLDEDTKKMYAYGYKKNDNGYLVNKIGEINLLNKIIAQLNKKYIRRKDVIFKNEFYARYLNVYDQKSYFAKIVDGKQTACAYEDIPALYDFYNTPNPQYIGRKNKKVDNPYSPYGNDFSDFNYTYGNYPNTQYTNYSNNRNRKRGRSGIGKKICIAFAGVTAVVSLTLGGKAVLSHMELPDLQIPILHHQESQLEQAFGDVDTKADTEAEQSLEAKYKNIQQQLEELGLENWQIAAELDSIALWNGHTQDISFFYDSDKDEVIFVYETLQSKEEEKESAETSETTDIPENIQSLMNTVKNNETLTEAEREAIIQLNLDKWIQYADIIDTDELITRYSLLDIEYDYQPEGAKVDTEYNPHARAAGVYHHAITKFGNETKTTESRITLYNGDSLESSLEDDEKVLEHELNHANGEFSELNSGLVNEGYNDLLIADGTRYKNESLMAALLVETFGKDTLDAGYYGRDLQTALTNKIVEVSKRDREEVGKEVADLLDDVQVVLYQIGDIGDEFRSNSEVVTSLKSIFSRLEEYHKQINERKMEDNTIASIIESYFIEKDTLETLKNNEHFSINKYDLENGTLDVRITSDKDTIVIHDGIYDMQSEGKHSRTVQITPDNKYSGTSILNKVDDSQIDYITR